GLAPEPTSGIRDNEAGEAKKEYRKEADRYATPAAPPPLTGGRRAASPGPGAAGGKMGAGGGAGGYGGGAPGGPQAIRRGAIGDNADAILPAEADRREKQLP